MNKTIQKVFLTTLVGAVLCAGTVSARQLRSGANALGACSGSCSIRVPCSAANCACAIPNGSLVGKCEATTLKPAK